MLVVGLFCVLADEVYERALFTALGGGEFDAVLHALREEVGQDGAVGKVNGDVDGARDVGLVEVKLLEERGEECGGREDGGLGFERLKGGVLGGGRAVFGNVRGGLVRVGFEGRA